MIRLIASDLDGTLLQKDGMLPPETFSVIKKLKEAGIIFCAASGRQYANLKRLFFPVHQDMAFICENGSQVVMGNHLSVTPIPAHISAPLIQDILDAGMQLLLSTPETCIMLTNAERTFTDDIFYRLRNTCTMIVDYHTFLDEFIKISGFHPDGVSHLAPSLQKKWSSHLHADIAGAKWLDFTMTNKADGIRALSGMLHIDTQDMAAFGDQFNDLSMLQSVGHPFLMENAPDALKAYGFSPCASVLDEIKGLFSL